MHSDLRRCKREETYNVTSLCAPLCSTLDPALQEQFEAYLERRGFTPELGEYIRGKLEDKEQSEYVAWLGRVAKFVS